MNQKKKKPIQKSKQQNIQAKKIQVSDKISKQQLFILFCLLVAVFIAYLPALNKDFINYDDDLYITNNPYIANFSFSNIPRIFGNFYYAQYSPLPTILYGIIHLMVGFNPFLYNLTGIFLHLITTLLVFQLIWALGKNFRVALLTAALFGLATIQVEAVAWLASVHKTAGYSIFFLSSLIVYIKYAETGKMKFYLISIFLFLISFLCKEQSVALSLAVVTIDVYLGRKLLSKKVLLEKIPFFVLSIILGLVTISAANSQYVVTTTSFSFIERIIYACYALCNYLFKIFIPYKLSMYYPYPSLKHLNFINFIYPLILILIIGLWLWAVKKKQTYILFGGLFFFVNILFSLALQIISVREVVMADRYVYIACIGLFFIVAKYADVLVVKKKIKFPYIAAAFCFYLLFFCFTTYSRTQVWKNCVTLYTNLLEQNKTLDIAYRNRGNYYRDNNKMDLAFADYSRLIEVSPDNPSAYVSRGRIYFDKGKNDKALADFDMAVKLGTKDAEAFSNRGAALASAGKYELALKDFNKAIKINPDRENTFKNRALTYEMLGKYNEAVADYYQSLKIKPNDADVYINIGIDKQHLKKFRESLEDFDKAISINPKGIYFLSRSYSWNALGDKQKALADVQTAIKSGAKVDPDYLAMLQKF